jgi:hypothetical protein
MQPDLLLYTLFPAPARGCLRANALLAVFAKLRKNLLQSVHVID